MGMFDWFKKKPKKPKRDAVDDLVDSIKAKAEKVSGGLPSVVLLFR